MVIGLQEMMFVGVLSHEVDFLANVSFFFSVCIIIWSFFWQRGA
jgi:hypothetical protein